MKKIALVYIAQNSLKFAINSFEALGVYLREDKPEIVFENDFKTYTTVVNDLPIELFIVDQVYDNDLVEYFKPFTKSIIKNETLAKSLNQILSNVQSDYLCIIPSGLYLDRNWLIDLIYYYSNVKKSGIIGIVNDFKQTQILPLPSSDSESFIHVVCPNDNLINGLTFFSLDTLFLLGGFDDSLNLKNNEINQYCLRATAKGLNNYYIASQCCAYFKVDDNTDELFESENNLKLSLSNMKIANNYYISLKA